MGVKGELTEKCHKGALKSVTRELSEVIEMFYTLF